MDNLDIVVEVIPSLPNVVMIWVVLFFLFMLLRKLLYNPISNFINTRKEAIQSDIDNARLLNDEAEQLKLEYESRISEAREESQNILTNARARGEELKTEILAEAREEAETVKLRSRKDIDRERAAAFESVRAETGEMALMIASKIMEKEINLENQNQLVDQFIEEVGSTPWEN